MKRRNYTKSQRWYEVNGKVEAKRIAELEFETGFLIAIKNMPRQQFDAAMLTCPAFAKRAAACAAQVRKLDAPKGKRAYRKGEAWFKDRSERLEKKLGVGYTRAEVVIGAKAKELGYPTHTVQPSLIDPEDQTHATLVDWVKELRRHVESLMSLGRRQQDLLKEAEAQAEYLIDNPFTCFGLSVRKHIFGKGN